MSTTNTHEVVLTTEDLHTLLGQEFILINVGDQQYKIILRDKWQQKEV